jgi:hypothetical protein
VVNATSKPCQVTLITNNLQVVTTGLTAIERRIISAIQNLKACLDIAISLSKTSSKEQHPSRKRPILTL